MRCAGRCLRLSSEPDHHPAEHRRQAETHPGAGAVPNGPAKYIRPTVRLCAQTGGIPGVDRRLGAVLTIYDRAWDYPSASELGQTFLKPRVLVETLPVVKLRDNNICF